MRGLAAVSTLLLFSSVSSQNDLQEELAARVEQFVQGTAYSSECGNIHRQATSKQPLLRLSNSIDDYSEKYGMMGGLVPSDYPAAELLIGQRGPSS